MNDVRAITTLAARAKAPSFRKYFSIRKITAPLPFPHSNYSCRPFSLPTILSNTLRPFQRAQA
jgi:hypothetical protein